MLYLGLRSLQFYPSDAASYSAMRYTGRFAMRWGVQQRVLRKEHPDAHYCAAIFLYLRGFICKFRAFASIAFTDDKVSARMAA